MEGPYTKIKYNMKDYTIARDSCSHQHTRKITTLKLKDKKTVINLSFAASLDVIQRLKIETKLEVHNGCVSILRNLNTCFFVFVFL